MKYPSKPILGTLINRPNRFLGIVKVDGEEKKCFIPNPGRMHELMIPGTKVYLTKKSGINRKTEYDLILVEINRKLVSIDSRLPNYLLKEAINENRLTEFMNYKVDRLEPQFNDSRLDLKLTRNESQLIVETKSCTLVEEKVALFPDAPTKRGARHMKTLIKALEFGEAAVCFIIQRDDADSWSPNIETDHKFAYNVIEAINSGVKAYAYTCKISLEEISLDKSIPINLKIE
jgi:sugar fermentation stimulation protein A